MKARLQAHKPLVAGASVLLLALLVGLAFFLFRGDDGSITVGGVRVSQEMIDGGYRQSAAIAGITAKDRADCERDAECRKLLKQLDQQAARAATEQAWIFAEAKERGLSVSDQEIDRAWQRYKLNATTEADARRQARMALLQQQMVKQDGKRVDPVTDRDVRTFYDQNPEVFNAPATRNVSIVTLASRDDIEAIARGMRSGRSNLYSELLKVIKGDLRDTKALSTDTTVTRADFSTADGKRIFRLDIGDLSDVVRYKGKWAIMIIEAGTEARNLSFAKAKDAIRQGILSDRGNAAYQEQQRKFVSKWRKRTKCTGPYITPTCSNGPAYSDSVVDPTEQLPETQLSPEQSRQEARKDEARFKSNDDQARISPEQRRRLEDDPSATPKNPPGTMPAPKPGSAAKK